jgi:beta-1,4-glucosyltransferase
MTLGAVDPPPFPTRNILGVEISVARQREAIEFLLARLAARLPTQVAFANANLLTELSGRPGGARLLDGFLVLNDGIAVDLASLALYRLWFPENLNGTDLIPALLAVAPRGTRVSLYGAKPEVVAKTAALLEERYGCAVCGAIDGFTVAAPEAVARHLSAGAPTCPRQPSAGGVDRYSRAHDRRAADDRGWGALRFLGRRRAARPRPMRRLRLEWLYRWAQEPRRLRPPIHDRSAVFNACAAAGAGGANALDDRRGCCRSAPHAAQARKP